MGTLCWIVFAMISLSGGQPTGVTAFIVSLRIKLTASPSRKICTSCPASAKALAWRKAKAAFVGSSEPQALLIRTFIGLLLVGAPRFPEWYYPSVRRFQPRDGGI